ncbi:MAG: DUF1707 domain-containing protein [Actinobacteria bacterium]|nr:DUF1707 domain-containing protein [Actinomycetota bacterium]
MTQWENLPEPVPERQPATVTPSWSGFSADPRQPENQPLRASDADRDFTTRLLDQARAEGRLDAAERDARASQALASRTLGELGPLVSDLMVPAASAPPAGAAAGRPGQASAMVRGWLGLAILLNGIWLITVVATGHFIYYWPIWPMLGTAIPLFFAFTAGGNQGGQAGHRAGRTRNRDERRALRDERRGELPPPPESDLR